MKKNEIEIEKYFIDYLVKTIKDKNLSSLEVTRTLSDKHKLKIKINNSVSSPTNQEVQTIKVENSSFKRMSLSQKKRSITNKRRKYNKISYGRYGLFVTFT